MENFDAEFNIGEIHFRDRWQFELKSEFFHSPELENNVYKQEFYFFIPTSLQINSETYSSKQFYLDQTNLIRYKTPRLTFEQILDPNNTLSPINRIDDPGSIEYELKLLANIVRSAIREQIRNILNKIEKKESIFDEVAKLTQDIAKLKGQLPLIEGKLKGETPLWIHFKYTEEFICNAIHFYLAGLLKKVRESKLDRQSEIDQALTSAILKEADEQSSSNKTENKEYFFYKRGLLNKFILDALLLRTSRLMVYNKYNNLIAAISAGVAMFFFATLLAWQGSVFIINSIPFIVITILLYIAKDRIKEGIKNISYQHFHRWFPDYNTEIRSPDDEHVVGIVEESFNFLDEAELPKEIRTMRHREFHAVLESIKRPERVIYYKRSINLMHPPEGADVRKDAINVIFRFNVSQFVHKADNPFHTNFSVNRATGELVKEKLPKVYHLNIILKNTLNDRIEFKKFRLILDKNGIKRLEQLTAH